MLATGEPVKLTKAVDVALQSTWSAIELIDGNGFTVMEKFWGMPEQAFENGVTDIDEYIGIFETFVAVNALMFPVPDNPNNPVFVLLLVHW